MEFLKRILQSNIEVKKSGNYIIQIFKPLEFSGSTGLNRLYFIQSNMENLNAVFINEEIPQKDRLVKLNQIAIQQMKILQETESRKLLK